MNDIFKDMQAKVGCEYISDLHEWRNDFPTVSTRSSAKLQYE